MTNPMKTTREEIIDAFFHIGCGEIPSGETLDKLEKMCLHYHQIIEDIGEIEISRALDGTVFTEGHWEGQKEMLNKIHEIINRRANGQNKDN